VKKPTPGDVLFGALVAWTIAATAIVVRIGFTRSARPTRAAPQLGVARVSNWQQFALRGYAFGPAAAPTTLVVFSDFQCPFCRRFSLVIDSLRARHPDVRIVERHFPLVGLHDAAFAAALAAECAKDAGRYEEMRHAMFYSRALVADAQWGLLANHSGIRDTAALAHCVDTQRHADVVRADIQAGQGIGIHATPSVLVNDSLYAGALTLAELEQRMRKTVAAN
jgi:protein-disulfide isomerase